LLKPKIYTPKIGVNWMGPISRRVCHTRFGVN
jgi:hypothetical protein